MTLKKCLLMSNALNNFQLQWPLLWYLPWTCGLTTQHVHPWHVGAARGLVLKQLAKSRSGKESRSQIPHQTGFPYYSHASQGSLPASEFRRHSWAIPSSKRGNWKWIKELQEWSKMMQQIEPLSQCFTTILEWHFNGVSHLRSVSHLIATQWHSVWNAVTALDNVL